MFFVKILTILLFFLSIERWKLLEAKWYHGNYDDINAKAQEEGKKTHFQMFDIVKGKSLFKNQNLAEGSTDVTTATDWQTCLMICIKVMNYFLLDNMDLNIILVSCTATQ